MRELRAEQSALRAVVNSPLDDFELSSDPGRSRRNAAMAACLSVCNRSLADVERRPDYKTGDRLSHYVCFRRQKRSSRAFGIHLTDERK